MNPADPLTAILLMIARSRCFSGAYGAVIFGPKAWKYQWK